MIVVRLKGGMGNQMFQYALGKSLACKHNTKLGLDISLLKKDEQKHTYRKYSLDIFNLPSDIMIADFANNFTERFFDRIFKNKKKLNLISEHHFYHFDNKIFQLPDNSCFDGYWQCFKYFDPYADVIKKDFSFKKNLTVESEMIAKQIQSSLAVSIHIRRGDYITNAETRNYHGGCDMDYYTNAIQLIRKKNQDVSFFVFSDDPDWVRENFNPNVKFHIVSKTEMINATDEFHLMTLCKHAIIANSSFSWWGAWLINNPEKIIIAPKKWIQDATINTDDLFPASWIRI